MRTRLLAGRTFTDADNTPEQSAKVVIDDLVAAQAYPERHRPSAGRCSCATCVAAVPNAPTNNKVEIIGVVAHQRHESLTDLGREAIFFVDAYGGFGAPRWAVRTSGDPASLASAVAAAVKEMDARVPIAEVQPMQALSTRPTGRRDSPRR